MRLETLFLRAVLLVLALPVLALAIFALPEIAQEAVRHFPAHWVYLAVGGLYLAAIPFFFALYQAMQLLGYIAQQNAFSDLSVGALQRIKYAAISISILFVTVLPLVALAAEADDAPGLAGVGLLFVLAPLVIAVVADLLQRLVRSAIERFA